MHLYCPIKDGKCDFSSITYGKKYCGFNLEYFEDFKKCPKKPKPPVKRTGKAKRAMKNYSLHVANHPEEYRVPFKELGDG